MRDGVPAGVPASFAQSGALMCRLQVAEEPSKPYRVPYKQACQSAPAKEFAVNAFVLDRAACASGGAQCRSMRVTILRSPRL